MALKLEVFAVFLVLGVLVQSVSFLTVVVLRKIKRDEIISPEEQNLCVQCSDVFKNDTVPDRFKDQISISKDGACCGKTSDILGLMVNKTLIQLTSKQSTHSEYAQAFIDDHCENTALGTPSIHLNKTARTNDTSGVVYWDIGSSLNRKDIDYEENHGHIVIKIGGFYFVTSHIAYHEHVNGSDKEESVMRNHTVHHVMKDTNTTKVLLESHQIQCAIKTDGCRSSHVGGLFKFEHGDKMFVHTSHLKHVRPDSNFVSMFMVKKM